MNGNVLSIVHLNISLHSQSVPDEHFDLSDLILFTISSSEIGSFNSRVFISVCKGGNTWCSCVSSD